MRTAKFSILLAAGAMLALSAHAQVPTSLKPLTDDQRNLAANNTDNHRLLDGVSALQAKNFTVAEAVFGEMLQHDQSNADANFYMGVAKMSLGKWDEAKKYLEVAVKKSPKNPDPKSRLGVTYAKLGDTAGANAQRADLVKMDKDCKGTCRYSQFILDGIVMIDQALAQPPAPPAAAPTPPAPPKTN